MYSAFILAVGACISKTEVCILIISWHLFKECLTRCDDGVRIHHFITGEDPVCLKSEKPEVGVTVPDNCVAGVVGLNDAVVTAGVDPILDKSLGAICEPSMEVDSVDEVSTYVHLRVAD